MANKMLREILEARIKDLEYQVIHGKLAPKIALTAMMEETIEECIKVLNQTEAYDGELAVIVNAIGDINIKE